MASLRSSVAPTARRHRSPAATAASWLALAVLLAGCGGSSGEKTTTSDQAAGRQSGFPATVRAANGAVRVPREPRRILSLSPTATETLYAIGAGRQVVAVDEQSDYPKQAPRTKLQPSQPNVEAIARYRPDLVVISDTSPADLAKSLRKLGVTVLSEPSAKNLDDAYDQIRDLGAATGHAPQAGRVVDGMRSKMQRLFAAAPKGAKLSVYHELQPDLYAASSQTFIGGIYKRLGLSNVADAAARKTKSPYPQLSSEAVVSADPDLIVLADTKCCKQSAATVAKRSGWGDIKAVKSHHVVAVDTDIAARWGPRLPQLVEQLVGVLGKVQGNRR